MHTKDARKAGESEERLHMVAVWPEAAHFFTEKEQAALALTEAVTLVARGGVPDDVYARAAAHFDEPELAGLLALIFTINTWNRIALSTAKVAGHGRAGGPLTGGVPRPRRRGVRPGCPALRAAPSSAPCAAAAGPRRRSDPDR